jgi:N4-gp56 family major capsid protein
MATTTTTTLSNQYQNYFSKKLLSYAVQALVLDQFAQKAPLPSRAGHKAITMFRYGAPSTSSIEALTEGTAPSGTRTLSLAKIEKALSQRGQVIQLTDILTATDLFNSLSQSIKTNGQDAALDMDTITRNTVVGSNIGGTAMEGGYAADMSASLDNGDTLVELYADGTKETTAATQYTAFEVSTGSGTLLDAPAVLNAVTQLKVNRAQPAKGGMYVAAASPQVISDVMTDSTWINAAQYSNVQDLYKGEVGSLYGAKVIMTTNPFISGDANGTDADRVIYDASGGGGTAGTNDVHATLFLGSEAYGCPDLSSQSPFSPKVEIVDTADKSDPLNQLTTCSFKTFWTALRLNPNYYVVMRSKTASTA